MTRRTTGRREGARAAAPTSPPKPPDEAALREAAVATLAARATSVAGLEAVLRRRIAAWARRAARAGLDDEAVAEGSARAEVHVGPIVARLVAIGVLDDAAYAERRAAGLARAGKSRRAITQDLAQKGVPRDLVDGAVTSDRATELAAAVTLARKRRLGPFARQASDSGGGDSESGSGGSRGDDDVTERTSLGRARGRDASLARAKEKQRVLGTFARAGFSFDVASRVLGMDREEAEALLSAHAPRGW